MQKRVMILLLTFLLLTSTALAATTVTDSSVITSGEFIGTLNWSNLESYPTPCATGSYLTAVNDTTTCVSAVPSYTNIVLSNSTLMNTTILQLVANLSGGASAVSSYANIALTNQSNTLLGNQTITQLSTTAAITNISGILLINPTQSTTTRTISVEGNDLTINGTGSGVLRLSMDRVDFSGVNNWVNFGYKTSKGAVLENIVPVPVCNNTNYGQLIFPQSYGVLSYCAGNGWRNITDTTNTASPAGVSYGTSVSGNAVSLLEGGSFGLELTNTNASAESSFRVASPGNSNGNTAFQVYVQGTTNNGLVGPFNQVADSILMVLDGARQNRISVSYGQNLTFNIGDGAGNYATTDQVLFGADRVQIRPNNLLQLQQNSSAIACNAGNAGSIIFSSLNATTKTWYGCDGTNWIPLFN